MLVHLSSTSPYICDISLGPIEQANRMSSARMKHPCLDIKESFPRLQPVRTPLKLLAPDEVPMDTSVATTTTTTTDMNTSRQTSLQPVWYTEQTIVDDNISVKSSNRQSILPTIESNSPDIEQEPLLERKSSTFILEPQILNDSEKENDVQHIVTSTQQDSTRHPTEPSDESFRALEHLLGLGSTQINLTMTTTAQESPKSNHESLSLTVVTPTELINQTTNSFLSYAPAGSGSLPSSQNILLMPTIESITEPSMNSTIPPPFSVDNSDTEETSSTPGTVVLQDSSIDDKDDSNDFSFELNDFTNNSRDDSTPPIPAPPPIVNIRPPTSADVAFRALVKARSGGRISQPVKVQSPLVKTLTTRASVPNLSRRVLRSSKRCESSTSSSQNSTIEEVEKTDDSNEPYLENENKSIDDDFPQIELVEVVSLSENEDAEPEQNGGITLNLTATKELNTTSPTSAEEADRSASTSCSSFVSNQPTPIIPKMPVLSREFTFNTPMARPTRSSERRRSILINPPSSTRLTQSLIPTIPEQLPSPSPAPVVAEEESVSLCLIPSSAKSMLSPLSTNPTVISEAPPIILQKSLAGSASPSPNPTPTLTSRETEYLSSNLSPRRSINPLYSSTPSIRKQSLQLVSIGEQEQVSTTVPPQLTMDLTNDEIETMDQEQQTDVPIDIHHVIDEGIQTSPERPPRRLDIGVQTTPSLDPSSRRRFQTMEQQTSPIVTRISTSSSSSSCQTTPLVVKRSSQPLAPAPAPPPIAQQENTPIHTKAIVHLRRNVRFQFTPSTDARLAAKEKLEEQRQIKQEVIVPQPILSDNEREEDTEDEMKKTKKKITTSKKKKALPVVQIDESSEEINESPVVRSTRNKTSTEMDVTSTTQSKAKPSKRSTRQEKKVEPEVVVTTTSPPQPTKRTNRKRPNPKTSTTSPPEPTTSPTEPVIKRPKTSENAPIVPPPEPVERPPAPKKMKKSASENSIANKRKTNPIVAAKKGKRRLHSVEQDEGLNTADEEEPVPEKVETIDLTSEEREKIEGSTVVELKNRLTTHGENIPKGARKAELIALVIQIETNLLRQNLEKKQVEAVAEPPSRKTRRNK